jgi:hypothetical protein
MLEGGRRSLADTAKAASDCEFAAFDGVLRIMRMHPTPLIVIDCQAISNRPNFLACRPIPLTDRRSG